MSGLADAVSFVQKEPEKYREWLEDPVTQLMIRALKDRSAPKMLAPGFINGDTALHMQGFNAGQHAIINLLENFKSALPAMQDEEVATWAMRENLLEQGWSPAETESMMQDIKTGKIIP